MKTIFEQHLENLPKEILCLMRFFPATILPDGKKKPLIDKWNDPKFQSFAGDAYQHAKAKCSVTPPFAAFDTSGHGKGTDYALIDLDNVRDAKTGEITNPDAEKWLNYFKSEFEGCYCELSQSQSGFHFLCRPTVGKFDVIKNTKRAGGVLVFDKEKGAQLEISYKMDAKSCHLTGNLFECEPNAPILAGEVADGVIEQILRAIQSKSPKKKKSATPRADGQTLPAEIQELADRINDITPDELTAKGYLRHSENGDPEPNGYICPWCGSGTHASKTGALTYYDTPEPHFTCHAQGCGGDVIKFLSEIYGIDNSGEGFFKLIRRAANDFNIDYDPKIFERPTEAYTQDKIKSCPLNLRLPKNFLFSANGITYAEPPRKEGGKPSYHTVTLTPIIPTKKFRDPVKGIVEYEFALLNCGEWQAVEVDGATLADTRDLKKILGKHGALIDEPAILSRYLNATIALNADALPWIKSYKQTGWTTDDYDHFACPANGDSVIRREGYDYEKIFKPKGDADKWREKFIEVMEQGGAPARVSFGVAAAALLVRPLNLPNLQAHVYGRRSIGKTPLLKFCVSAFGDPNLNALSYSLGATSPKSRLELSAAFSDLPLVAEELESINKRDAEHLPQDIYSYSLGIGGQVLKKDGTLRAAKIFSGARLTDGEHEITNSNGNGGELKRVLPLRCATLLDEDFASDLHGFCKKHHGHFLKSWIRYIIEHRDEIERTYHQAKKITEIRHSKKYDSTQIATLVAAVIAYQHFKICIGLQDNGNNDELTSDIEAILRSLPTADDIDDAIRAKDVLCDCVVKYAKFFVREVDKPEFDNEFTQTATECYGKIFKNGEVAFIHSVLKKLLETEGGFTSADKLINEFYDRGYLRHCNGLNTFPTWINGKSFRAVRFVSGVIADAEQDSQDKMA